MPASLEPPSLRRRGGDDPGEPAAPHTRGRVYVALYSGVAVVLIGVLGGVIYAFVSIGGSHGRHEDVRTSPSGIASTAPAEQLPPAEYDAVESAGRTALSTWARPGVGYAAWWHRLSPLLSSSARTDYAATDPGQLPQLRLERKASVAPGPSEDTATVYLDTTAGKFGVDLTRQGPHAPWRTLRFLFPGEKSSLS